MRGRSGEQLPAGVERLEPSSEGRGAHTRKGGSWALDWLFMARPPRVLKPAKSTAEQSSSGGQGTSHPGRAADANAGAAKTPSAESRRGSRCACPACFTRFTGPTTWSKIFGCNSSVLSSWPAVHIACAPGKQVVTQRRRERPTFTPMDTLLPLKRRKQSSKAIGFVGWSGQGGQRANNQA